MFIVIIGGIGTTAGPVVGAVLYVILSEYLANTPGYSNNHFRRSSRSYLSLLPTEIMGTLQIAVPVRNSDPETYAAHETGGGRASCFRGISGGRAKG